MNITIIIQRLLKKILSLPKNLVRFLRQTLAEMKFVQWINRKQVFGYTLFTLIFLIIGAIALIGIDKALLLLRGLIIPTS